MAGNQWEEGVEPVDNSKKVYIHNLVEVVTIFPAASEANSCIESEQVDFTCLYTISSFSRLQTKTEKHL